MPTNAADRQARPAKKVEESLPTDYYELLQVSPKADPEVIEAAYRRLALKYHPDHNPLPEAALRMQALNTAYAALKDPERRAEYDNRPPDPTYTGDLSEDDYEPPDRRLAGWNRMAGRLGWARLGWLAVGLLLMVVVLTALAQNGANTAASAPVTASVPPSQVSALPPNALFFDDFESIGAAYWTLDAPWHLTTRYSNSGKRSLWFGDEGRSRYSSNLSIAATLVRPLDLGKAPSPTLRFRLVGQSDHEQLPNGEDRLFIEVAEPGRDFQTIFSANGLYANWQDFSLDLSRWKGKNIIFRFRFSSGTLNSGAGFSGFFIDDVRVDKEK